MVNSFPFVHTAIQIAKNTIRKANRRKDKAGAGKNWEVGTENKRQVLRKQTAQGRKPTSCTGHLQCKEPHTRASHVSVCTVTN